MFRFKTWVTYVSHVSKTHFCFRWKKKQNNYVISNLVPDSPNRNVPQVLAWDMDKHVSGLSRLIGSQHSPSLYQMWEGSRLKYHMQNVFGFAISSFIVKGGVTYSRELGGFVYLSCVPIAVSDSRWSILNFPFRFL
jgi:hypothetical protein